MAITNGYATLEELKARLDITGTEDDSVLEQVIEAASRQVDGWCGRAFASGTGVRHLTADAWNLLILPDDLHAMTAIAVDRDGDRSYDTVWELTDVDLQPYPGPYHVLRPRNGRVFPTHAYAVQITGDWGFGIDVPAPIREATLLQATRLYKRTDAPFGVTGSAEHGQLQTISRVDPDVKELLQPFVRVGMVV